MPLRGGPVELELLDSTADLVSLSPSKSAARVWFHRLRSSACTTSGKYAAYQGHFSPIDFS
jgi:hypothetical protein